MNKQNLIHALKAERKIIDTALVFSHIVFNGKWENQFQKYANLPGEIEIKMDSSKIFYRFSNHSDLIALYKNPVALNSDCFALVRVTIRNAITQFYEKIHSFCHGDGTRQPKWEQAPWRPLASLARNSMSHDFILNFWNNKKNSLRADVNYTFPSGKALEIKNTEHEKPITGDNLPLNLVIELLDVMENFVEKEL